MNPRLKQQGMTLIMLLFIVGLAATAYLVHAFNPVTVKIERDKKTAQALAEAKSLLVGYAITPLGSRPGELPCPDNTGDGNYDGTQDSPCAGVANRLGKLSWRSAAVVGLNADLQDSTGERLWYAVSRNMVDALTMFNSDTAVNATYPWLSVYDAKGNLISNKVAAAVVAPGSPIGGQSRVGVTPNAAQYLDKATLTCGPGPCAPIVRNNASLASGFISASDFRNVVQSDPTYQQPYEFNDKLTFLTIDELMPQVEMRVAREVKNCLDEYATASDGKYPWPERTDGGAFGIGNPARWFGRLPVPPVFPNPPVSPNIETGAGPDPLMSAGWTPACTALFTSSYWPDWRDLVFYQVADNFAPGGVKNCAGGTCISISGSGNPNPGSGNYRAVVIVAAKKILAQARVITTSASEYLEDDAAVSGFNNDHQAAYSHSFVTYKPSTPPYAAANDLVLCLDGKNACK